MHKIFNLVFEGGGVLGISYLGVLKYLYENNIMKDIKRAAGTSAGAITACITSFALSFEETKAIADSLDYKKIPEKEEISELNKLPDDIKQELEKVFGDLECLYRLVTSYGWYSTSYFYTWLQNQIADQFDKTKKLPPYTFSDFKDSSLHKNEKPFLDLYIIGTDTCCKTSKVFSYKTTPDMEVAEAVKISMSIPLFFEANRIKDYSINGDSNTHIFSDGGVMRNYPINIFDTNKINNQTLGSRFKYTTHFEPIHNLPQFISNFFLCYTKIQQDIYRNSPQDIARSIEIDTKQISPIDFNITTNDNNYKFLFSQGYNAAKAYFAAYS